jgi:regulator of replication initiation timing
MEAKSILELTDPRDAFMFMLLERVNKLEDTIQELKTDVVELQDKNKRLVVTNNKFHSYQTIGGVKLAIGCSTTSIQDVKNELETCVNLIVDKLGNDNLLECFHLGQPKMTYKNTLITKNIILV